VVRKPFWNGEDFTNVARSSPALVQHGSSNLSDLATAVMVSWLHSRSAKL